MSTNVLTARQLEIGRLLISGATNQEIARSLHVELCTIKAHVQMMRSRVGAKNRVELAVKLATEYGVR